MLLIRFQKKTKKNRFSRQDDESEMTVRNRKRGVGDLSNQHDGIDAKRSGKEELDCVIEVGQPKARKTPTLSTLVWWILHLIAVGFVAYGVILGHTKVFHHEECSMTYSWRIFLPTSLVSQTTPYRLYQFMDSRDTRFRTLMQAQKPLAGRQGCWNGTSTAILYIPGHGGDFEQSRSIGAHGMQMTHRNDDRIRRHKIQRAIQSQNFSGDATELKNFVFPVYAADFQEEGTGLHGIFTQQQATFVAEAIQYLTESSCGYQHILIVSHSMGGHAALLAYQENTTVRRYVNNIVNLGTPHAFPVLAFDRSLYDLHQKLSSGPFYSDLAMVSISGGLRDEMIPVEACDATKMHQSNTLSLLASSVMERKKDLAEDTLDIGCDHRALVWCHNLLSSIRTIIFQLIQSQQGGLAPEHRLLQVTSQVWESSEKFPSYKELVSVSYSNLDVRFCVTSKWTLIVPHKFLFRTERIGYLECTCCRNWIYSQCKLAGVCVPRRGGFLCSIWPARTNHEESSCVSCCCFLPSPNCFEATIHNIACSDCSDVPCSLLDVSLCVSFPATACACDAENDKE